MGNLEQKLNELFSNLPPLSSGAKETTAKFLPWVLIVLGVLGMLAWVSALRFYFGFMGVAQHFGFVGPSFIMIIHLLLAPIVQVMSVYGGYLMLSRKLKGWRLAFYGLVIGVISNFLAVSVFGLIISCLVAYFLFQIRELYTES